MTKEDLIEACQLMINSYGGKHGNIEKVLDIETWVTVDNDIYHHGTKNWILYIVFTGSTGEWADWKSNFDSNKMVIPYDNNKSDIRVHEGFLTAYKKMRDDILNIVKDFNDVRIIGQSRGSALATLGAVDINYNYPTKNISIITAGSPRVGNKPFADSFNRRIKDSYRIVNNGDFVSAVPYAPFFWHVEKQITIGGFYPLQYIPILRIAGVENHYPEKYLENMKKYSGKI